MIKIKLRDANFRHNKSGSTSPFFASKHIKWVRSIEETPIVVYTDLYVPLAHQWIKDRSHKNIAWLLEPRTISPWLYRLSQEDYAIFDVVATHDIEFAKTVPNAVYVPFGTSWIPNKDWSGSWNKAPTCSIIASRKNSTQGHRLRHTVAKEYAHALSKFGEAYTPVATKTEALSPFMYSVVIENGRIPGYFTEKIIDCFATKTVPIYWGDPCINDHFNKDGILTFDKSTDLKDILSSCTAETYKSMKDAVDQNFELAKAFVTSEDSLYNKAVLKVVDF